ncbi:MAG: aminopeptidase, partial [Candidatus Binataceae bacterium]
SVARAHIAVAAAIASRLHACQTAAPAIVASICLLLAGCQIGYLARAAYQTGRLLWNRKPISYELARADLDPEVRAKLKTVLQVRDFARDQLGLNVGNAYRTITPVDQSAIVYVLMAAPKDSLSPYTWWFPIVGSVPYQGFFDPAAAKAGAEAFEAAGYDTLVRPAVAFSSLGFFNDPVLANLLQLDRVELAGVIIHELFHRTFFLAGDVMFDESAATYVGAQGAAEFFSATEGKQSRDAVEAREVASSELLFADFLKGEEAHLLKLYGSDLARAEILERREPIFRQIGADYARLKPQLSGLERFDLDQAPINNAVILNYRIYFHDLDNFSALQRRYDGDLRATIEQIIALAKAHPEDPFFAIWQAVQPGSG